MGFSTRQLRSKNRVLFALIHWPFVAAAVLAMGLLSTPKWASAQTVLHGDVIHITTPVSDTTNYQLAGAAYVNVDDAVQANWLGQVSDAPGPFHPLVKFGHGVLNLSATNTYSVDTVLLQGGLQLGHSQALGSSALSTTAGTALYFADGITLNNTIGLLPLNADHYLPFGVPLAPSVPSGFDDAVRWVVDSGQATHRGLLHGTVPLVKQGAGLLRLAGDGMSYSGPVFVEQGQLLVDDFLFSPVTVGAGARLGGQGTVSSLTVNTGATLAPGQAGTSFKVLNNVQFAPGSQFTVNVLANGQASQLIAGGQVQLDGQVLAKAEDGQWNESTQYTIVQANGGLSGQFDGVSTNLAFLDASLSYEPQQVNLQLQRNDTPLNQPAKPDDKDVADAVDNGPDDVKDAVLGTSPSGARQAFARLANRWAPTVASLVLDDSRWVREAVLAQAVAATAWPTASNNGLWLSAFGGGSRQSSGWHAGRLHGKTGGFVAGKKWALKPQLNANVFMGGQHAHYSGYQHGAKAQSAFMGAALSGQTPKWQWQVGASYQYSRLHAQRSVQVAYLQQHLKSRYSSHLLQAFSEVALNAQESALQPFARLSVLHSTTPSLSETGGSMAVKVARQRQTVVLATLGARWQKPFTLNGNKATWFGTLALDHAMGQRRPTTTQRFAQSTGPSFTAQGTAYGRNAVQLATGLRVNAKGFGWVEVVVVGRVT